MLILWKFTPTIIKNYVINKGGYFGKLTWGLFPILAQLVWLPGVAGKIMKYYEMHQIQCNRTFTTK